MGIFFLLGLFNNSTTMGKIMRKGRVVILLAGRRAGKKAIIVKQNDEGRKDKKFAHALVVGIDRCPRKVTKAMKDTKVERKSRMKPFVKYVNYNHLLPTRFMVKDDFEFRSTVTEDIMNNRESRKTVLAQLKTDFQARYMKNEGAEKQANANFLFSKLR